MDAVPTVTVRPERTTLAVVLVMLLGALPLTLSAWFLAPLLLVPVGAFGWVLRARVTATSTGLEVSNGLGTRRVAWEDVDGFHVPDRGPVVLLLRGGHRVRLTTVHRRDLPRLLAVSQPAAS